MSIVATETEIEVPKRFNSLADYYQFCSFWAESLKIRKIQSDWKERYEKFSPEVKRKLIQLFGDFFPEDDSIAEWNLIFKYGISMPARWNGAFYGDKEFYQVLKWFSKYNDSEEHKRYWKYIKVSTKARAAFWSTRTSYRHFVMATNGCTNLLRAQHEYLSGLDTQLNTFAMNRIIYEDVNGLIRREPIVRWEDKFDDSTGSIETQPIPFYYGICGPIWDSFEIVRYKTEAGKIIEVPTVLIMLVESSDERAVNDGEEESYATT